MHVICDQRRSQSITFQPLHGHAIKAEIDNARGGEAALTSHTVFLVGSHYLLPTGNIDLPETPGSIARSNVISATSISGFGRPALYVMMILSLTVSRAALKNRPQP